MADGSGIDGSFSFEALPTTMLAAEKEEAKAVLNLFLKKKGLSNAVAARTVNKSDIFIDHLILRLHSVHKSRYLVGSISTYYCLYSAIVKFVKLVSSISNWDLANQICLTWQDVSLQLLRSEMFLFLTLKPLPKSVGTI